MITYITHLFIGSLCSTVPPSMALKRTTLWQFNSLLFEAMAHVYFVDLPIEQKVIFQFANCKRFTKLQIMYGDLSIKDGDFPQELAVSCEGGAMVWDRCRQVLQRTAVHLEATEPPKECRGGHVPWKMLDG